MLAGLAFASGGLDDIEACANKQFESSDETSLDELAATLSAAIRRCRSSLRAALIRFDMADDDDDDDAEIVETSETTDEELDEEEVEATQDVGALGWLPRPLLSLLSWPLESACCVFADGGAEILIETTLVAAPDAGLANLSVSPACCWCLLVSGDLRPRKVLDLPPI